MDDLNNLLSGFEEAAARAFDAVLQDPATLKATSAAWAAWAQGLAHLPNVRVPPARPRIGQTVGGLGDSYPHALLASCRAGWSSAVGSLLPMAAARGANAFVIGPELGALQGALFTEPAPALAPTEKTLVWAEGAARLWRVGPQRQGGGPPLLVVAPLVNRSYVLDLFDGHSLLQRLVAGTERPVWLLDWGRGDEDLEGVVSLIGAAVARLERPALLGYCIGGTLAVVHAARHPRSISRIAIFASPVDASKGGRFTEWAGYADYDALSRAFPSVPSGWVHAPFHALRPTLNLLKLTRLVRRWRQPGHLRRFLAMELWNHDNVDLSAAFFREWGTRIYQENALFRGELADLSAITCPKLAIGARGDAIIPPDSVTALPGAERVVLGGGHVSPLTSPRGLDALCGALLPFLEPPPLEPQPLESQPLEPQS